MAEEQIKSPRLPETPSAGSEPRPEAGLESALESPKKIERPETSRESTPPTPAPINPLTAAAIKIKTPQQIREEKIDKVLEEGMSEIYLSLSPKDQKKFRQSGEETVKKINVLLSQTKIQIQKIIDLIKGWLSVVPGINKFFLEQEAKIKADKIIKIKNEN